MTLWESVTLDFPARCLRILDLHGPAARRDDCEVTLLVAVASASLVMPFERLGGAGGTWHPSADQDEFGGVAAELAKRVGGSFRDSEFCGRFTEDWLVRSPRFESDLDDEARRDRIRRWHDCPARPIATEPASKVFACIRNALAHGNVDVWPARNGDRAIGRLSFLSLNRDDARRLAGFVAFATSVAAFEHFLRAWLRFLGEFAGSADILARIPLEDRDAASVRTPRGG